MKKKILKKKKIKIKKDININWRGLPPVYITIYKEKSIPYTYYDDYDHEIVYLYTKCHISKDKRSFKKIENNAIFPIQFCYRYKIYTLNVIGILLRLEAAITNILHRNKILDNSCMGRLRNSIFYVLTSRENVTEIITYEQL